MNYARSSHLKAPMVTSFCSLKVRPHLPAARSAWSRPTHVNNQSLNVWRDLESDIKEQKVGSRPTASRSLDDCSCQFWPLTPARANVVVWSTTSRHTKRAADRQLRWRFSDAGRVGTLHTGATTTRVGKPPKVEAAGSWIRLWRKCASGRGGGCILGAA